MTPAFWASFVLVVLTLMGLAHVLLAAFDWLAVATRPKEEDYMPVVMKTRGRWRGKR